MKITVIGGSGLLGSHVADLLTESGHDVIIYDKKESKVVWSDRWEENWENLSSIQGNLSEGLLQVLDRKRKIAKMKGTTNTTAYEYNLQGLQNPVFQTL